MPRITSLPESDDVSVDDYIVIVDDTGTTPVTRRTTLGAVAQMVTTSMGNLTWRGAWDIGTAYVADDVVAYERDIYIALGATTGDYPPGVSEVQQLVVDATGGTFTITYAGQTTSALAFNASGATVTTALDALSNLSPGDIVVTGGPGNSGGSTPYVLTFGGDLAYTNVAQITASGASLTGGAGTATPSTTTAGTAPTDWQLWVPQGPPGVQGDDGEQGEQGEAGFPNNWDDAVYSGTPADYSKGTVIYHDDATWICTVTPPSGEPSSLVDNGWHRILVKGAKPWSTPTIWNDTDEYQAGTDYLAADAVHDQGSTYVCKLAVTAGPGNTIPAMDGTHWMQIAQKGDTGPVEEVTSGNSYITVTDPEGPIVTVELDATTLAAGSEVTDAVTDLVDSLAPPKPNAIYSFSAADIGVATTITVNATPKLVMETDVLVAGGGFALSQNYLMHVTGQVILSLMDGSTGYYITVWTNADWDGTENGWNLTGSWKTDITNDLSGTQPAMTPASGQEWSLSTVSELKFGSGSQLSAIPFSAVVPVDAGNHFAVRVVAHCTDNANPAVIDDTWTTLMGTFVNVTPVPTWTA